MEKRRNNGSSKGPTETVDALLGHLTVHEDGKEEFIWVDKVRAKKAKWLAIGRVQTSGSFSPSAMFADMRSAWNPTKHVISRRIEEILFTV